LSRRPRLYQSCSAINEEEEEEEEVDEEEEEEEEEENSHSLNIKSAAKYGSTTGVCRREGLPRPRHPVTAVEFKSAIKDTHCSVF